MTGILLFTLAQHILFDALDYTVGAVVILVLLVALAKAV